MNFKDVLGEELANQVQEKISAYNAAQTDPNKQANFVDLSEGRYVSRGRFDDRVNGLAQQVTELQVQIGQRDADMANLQQQLEAAVADSSKLVGVQQSLTTLQEQYATDQASWQERLNQQAYEFQIRELANGLKFSSTSAKNEFIRGAIAKKFQTENGKLLGFDDYVKVYQESDPGAFAKEQDPEEGKKPSLDISLGAQGGNPKRDETGFGFSFIGVRPHKQEE